MWRSAAERHYIYESATIPELAHRSQPVSRDDRDVFPLQYGEKETARLWGDGRKTVNSHSSLHCCGCSCILFCYMIVWN